MNNKGEELTDVIQTKQLVLEFYLDVLTTGKEVMS